MISLILPYWDRQEAANKAILQLAETYNNLDLEVVVVDDGNDIPFVAPETGLNLKIVRLPIKREPKCGVTAWNAGVKESSGDIIVLSCVEILHTTPVIQYLVDDLKAIGEHAYVHASTWCPDQNKWHVHSSVAVPRCPKGTHLHFCGAMYKSLYEKAGGMDEEYREGAGYEDNDFIYRLVSCGAKFSVRDDLVVIHPKDGATIKWGDAKFKRNEHLFSMKWPESLGVPVNFVCLKAGTAYGSDYVNILRDMVARNLPEGFPGRFICITDNPEGLDDGIEIIHLPDGLEGWWGKLYMFNDGVLPDGRIIFLDLDTLIIGPLDEIVKYEGDFAILRDFYRPDGYGSGVMVWNKPHTHIWGEWVKAGQPRVEGGDQAWIEKQIANADRLQDLFPGRFVSFKADCNPYPLVNSSVVCFHGQPKPENCMVPWVENVWKVGGAGMAELEAVANTSSQIVSENVKSACLRDIAWLDILEENEGQAVIVAGGPSLAMTFNEILWRSSEGQTIIAVNGSAKWLNGRGIIPDIHILIDSRKENLRFIEESKAKSRFLASQCDPSLFDASENITLFHMNTTNIEDSIPLGKKVHLISSGTTVGLAAMAVSYCLGYRKIHLYGFDSSYEENHHAYEQALNDADSVVEVVVENRKFKAAPWMVLQAQQFQELARILSDSGVIITVAGDGLLPYIARCMA